MEELELEYEPVPFVFSNKTMAPAEYLNAVAPKDHPFSEGCRCYDCLDLRAYHGWVRQSRLAKYAKRQPVAEVPQAPPTPARERAPSPREGETMRVIIAGSRSIRCPVAALNSIIQASRFDSGIDAGRGITEVISGGARGVDSIGGQWAERRGIPVKLFEPDWSLGHHAGILRNCAMTKYALEVSPNSNLGGLIAVWDAKSPGTRHMIVEAQNRGLATFVWLWS